MDFIKYSLLIFIFFIPLLSGCVDQSNASEPLPPISFKEIAAGAYTMSGLQENRKIEVFTDQQSLNSSLALYVQLVNEYTVDFTSKRAVLLSMGGRNTGGYSIGVERIEDNGDFIKLKVTLTKPGINCNTTQALTSPYQFIEVDSVKELIIEERVVVVNCSQ